VEVGTQCISKGMCTQHIS